MFDDDYRKEIENIKPDPEKLDELAIKMKHIYSEKKSRPKHQAGRLIALAACIALVTVAFPVSKFISRDNNKLTRIAEDYSDIYSVINNIYKANNIFDISGLFKSFTTKGEANLAKDSGTKENFSLAPTADNQGTTPQYSDTNLQVAGVQEADIIKTDGRYIYAVSNKYVYIVKVNEGKLSIVSKIERYKNYQSGSRSEDAFEMYVAGDRLVVLKNIYYDYKPKSGAGAIEPSIGSDASKAIDYYGYYGNVKAIEAEIYDITDKANIKSQSSLGLSGSYVSSRMVGDILYLVTSYTLYDKADKDNPQTYIPSLYSGDESAVIGTQDICIYENPKSARYTVVAGIDTSGEGKIISQKAVLGCGTSMYANSSSIYIATGEQVNENNVSYNKTNILRFSLDKGNVSYVASGSVMGNILNQFSMDEYDGVFRIVTTVNKYKTQTFFNNGNDVAISSVNDGTSNCLYTLDPSLKQLGKIEDVAPNERVYSVRFMGEIGYFVTFRQTDPLFSVDLSDAKNPKILSELKIPGFSEYLHPYSNGELFGFGKSADEMGRVTGLKLSMFDTTDPSDVKEKFTLEIKGNSWSEASYNHKAILIDANKKLIAFPTESQYLIYTYSDKTGFSKIAEISIDSQNSYFGNIRGLYIDNYMYVMTGYSLTSYSMSNYEIAASVTFD